MLNSDLSPAAPQGGRLPPTDKTRVVSTRRRVPTNWVSGRTLQPSIESVVANSFVPSDFLVDGQVSGLGTVHPLLTLSFVSTWILPIHVVSSTLKRESSSSVMDGLQRRREHLCVLSAPTLFTLVKLPTVLGFDLSITNTPLGTIYLVTP